jgi:hypothetical protein
MMVLAIVGGVVVTVGGARVVGVIGGPVAVVEMGVGLADEDADLGAHEGATANALAGELVVLQRQPRQLVAHHLLGHAQVEQRPQRHVAGDARETIEVQLGPDELAHE